MANPISSIAGQSFRWTFADGPTAGKTYEHTFNADGTVLFQDVAEGPTEVSTEGTTKSAIHYGAFEIAPGVHMISYLSGAEYTLTVSMNLSNGELHGFASNEKEWHPITGRSEVVK